jgi:ribonuclease P protein component
MKNVAVKENHLYNKAYSKGKRFSGRYVRVYVLKDLKAKRVMLANPEKKYINRLGISVSKKNGGAVVRNRIKRIIREGYRAIERDELLLTGNLVIIAARNEAADVKSTDIERELRYAFKKLDMLKKSDSSEN